MNEITAFMCIRLNSTRVPQKSIKDLGGRSLFCWSAETIDKLGIPFYINCNDGNVLENLLDFSPTNLKIISRDPFLDTNEARSEHHCLEFQNKVPSKNYLMTHCTSPFVTLKTYQKVITKVLKEKHASSQTVEKLQTFGWYKNKPLNFTVPREPTQELESIYIETMGAICYTKETLEKGSRIDHNDCAFVNVNSIEGLDIDTPEDFELAERYAAFITKESLLALDK